MAKRSTISLASPHWNGFFFLFHHHHIPMSSAVVLCGEAFDSVSPSLFMHTFFPQPKEPKTSVHGTTYLKERASSSSSRTNEHIHSSRYKYSSSSSSRLLLVRLSLKKIPVRCMCQLQNSTLSQPTCQWWMRIPKLTRGKLINIISSHLFNKNVFASHPAWLPYSTNSHFRTDLFYTHTHTHTPSPKVSKNRNLSHLPVFYPPLQHLLYSQTAVCASSCLCIYIDPFFFR